MKLIDSAACALVFYLHHSPNVDRIKRHCVMVLVPVLVVVIIGRGLYRCCGKGENLQEYFIIIDVISTEYLRDRLLNTRTYGIQ